MYIKNQVFKDEETLLEMIFDFSLGEHTSVISELIRDIQKELEGNTAYQEYRNTLEEEDRLELEAEEQDIRLAEALMERFDTFKTANQKLYGTKDGKETLLYFVDLV